MKRERIALFVVELAFKVAEGVAGWLEREERKRLPPHHPSTLSLKDLLEIKRANDTQVRRSQAPTVAITAPSERAQRGRGGPRY